MENQDFGWLGEPPQTEPDFVTSSSFGGTLRQSQIRLQAFGPDISGARTSADLQFDFAGGFPHKSNGVGLVPLRPPTGTIPLDLAHTSIVARDGPPFFPTPAPTHLAPPPAPPPSSAGAPL